MRKKEVGILTPLLNSYLKPWVHQCVDIILPPLPLFKRSGQSEADGTLWANIRFLDEPCCMACGFPFEYDLGEHALCGQCIARRPAYDKARSAFIYDDNSRKPILAFKHGGRTEGLSMFGAQMARAGRHLLSEADVLVPVPLHRSRLLKRRFNQSALLARAIHRHCGVAMNTDVLMRHKNTLSQGGQTLSGRRRNVSGAFTLHNPQDIAGKTVILIDDVFTTGATLEACARILRKAEVKAVHALTLARVVKGQAIPK